MKNMDVPDMGWTYVLSWVIAVAITIPICKNKSIGEIRAFLKYQGVRGIKKGYKR